MKKKVVYYIDARGQNPVWTFITHLPAQEREKCFEYIAYLETFGEDVRRPVGDYLGSKLYELRLKGSRILYFFMLRDYAVLVHAFKKKGNAIADSDMTLAQRRKADFVSRYEKGWLKLGE